MKNDYRFSIRSLVALTTFFAIIVWGAMIIWRSAPEVFRPTNQVEWARATKGSCFVYYPAFIHYEPQNDRVDTLEKFTEWVKKEQKAESIMLIDLLNMDYSLHKTIVQQLAALGVKEQQLMNKFRSPARGRVCDGEIIKFEFVE